MGHGPVHTPLCTGSWNQGGRHPWNASNYAGPGGSQELRWAFSVPAGMCLWWRTWRHPASTRLTTPIPRRGTNLSRCSPMPGKSPCRYPALCPGGMTHAHNAARSKHRTIRAFWGEQVSQWGVEGKAVGEELPALFHQPPNNCSPKHRPGVEGPPTLSSTSGGGQNLASSPRAPPELSVLWVRDIRHLSSSIGCAWVWGCFPGCRMLPGLIPKALKTNAGTEAKLARQLKICESTHPPHAQGYWLLWVPPYCV